MPWAFESGLSTPSRVNHSRTQPGINAGRKRLPQPSLSTPSHTWETGTCEEGGQDESSTLCECPASDLNRRGSWGTSVQGGAHGAQRPTRDGETEALGLPGGLDASEVRAECTLPRAEPFAHPWTSWASVQGCPLDPLQASCPRGVHAGAAPPIDATRASPKRHEGQRDRPSGHIS